MAESVRPVDSEKRRRAEMAELAEQLLGILGHDLRNPLSSVTMAAKDYHPRIDGPPRNNLRGKRVLVTGGSGFLGGFVSNLIALKMPNPTTAKVIALSVPKIKVNRTERQKGVLQILVM